MKEEIGVGIDAEELLSMLECNICLSSFNEPVTTKCGHTYCKSCIEACIKKNPECPDCKTALTVSDLVKNIPLEQMAQQIGRLNEYQLDKEIAEPTCILSPIVKILQKELRECITNFEVYCANIKATVEQLKQNIRNNNPPNAVQEIEELERRYNDYINTVIKQYERHMREEVKEPKIGTVNVVIQMPAKNVRIENYALKPYDSIKEVKVPIEKHFTIQGNPIIKWGPEVVYAVSLPNPNKRNFEVYDEKKTIGELNIVTGSYIVLKGTALCSSDASKPCITLGFKAEDKKAYNYFLCITCSLKWICEPCSQQCHKGHNLKEFLKDHVPQWSCCYCLKKNCMIPNKNHPG